jgi:hypothetical protein
METFQLRSFCAGIRPQESRLGHKSETRGIPCSGELPLRSGRPCRDINILQDISCYIPVPDSETQAAMQRNGPGVLGSSYRYYILAPR